MSRSRTGGLAGRVAVVTGGGRGIGRAIWLLRVSDDIDAILAQLTDVRRDKLYTLRIRNLPSSGGNPTLRAILEAAEQP